MKIEHLIISGDSFTSDGIGGTPPSDIIVGGCSYFDYPLGGCAVESTTNTPNTWAGHLALRYKVTSLVNLAAAGHGDVLVANTIIEILNRFKYNDNTLVVFNISKPERFDFACAFDHPDACSWIPWTPDIIPYSFLSRKTNLYYELKSQQGIEQVERMNANAIDFLFNLLENKKIPYAFMQLFDQADHKHMGPVVNRRMDHCIKFDGYPGMAEFCAANNATNPKDQFHPNALGQQLMTDWIQKHIDTFYGP